MRGLVGSISFSAFDVAEPTSIPSYVEVDKRWLLPDDQLLVARQDNAVDDDLVGAVDVCLVQR